MTTFITDAFVKKYEREVHHEFQQESPILMGSVFTKKGVIGESTSFPVIGKGTAVSKTRHAEVNPGNSTRPRVTCTLEDSYYGEFADDLDLLKVNHDERRAIAKTAAMALARKIDNSIITALGTTTVSIAANGNGMTKSKAKDALKQMGRNEALRGGRNTVVVDYEQWDNLLDIPEFASRDYVADEKLPFTGSGVEGKMWLGALWIPMNGLPKTGNERSCFRFHERAVGHAVGKPITGRVTEEGPREAFWVSARMSQGSCLIQEAGAIEILCEEA